MKKGFENIALAGSLLTLSIGATACGNETKTETKTVTVIDKFAGSSKSAPTIVNQNNILKVRYTANGAREIIFSEPKGEIDDSGYNSLAPTYETCIDGQLYSQTEERRRYGGLAASTQVIDTQQAREACKDNKLTPADFSQ